ncbi:hypothetical protein N7492_001762 [Penicillium capsulatum]|uniref:Uncharacterized protein n=1 Tax=Penicillium capsulatum TaxID=69766 RepID=A0A9W9IVB5_9EURO|nr:hypothetical protein N7492_001762 [Penicillium capsulatum]
MLPNRCVELSRRRGPFYLKNHCHLSDFTQCPPKDANHQPGYIRASDLRFDSLLQYLRRAGQSAPELDEICLMQLSQRNGSTQFVPLEERNFVPVIVNAAEASFRHPLDIAVFEHLDQPASPEILPVPDVPVNQRLLALARLIDHQEPPTPADQQLVLYRPWVLSGLEDSWTGHRVPRNPPPREEPVRRPRALSSGVISANPGAMDHGREDHVWSAGDQYDTRSYVNIGNMSIRTKPHAAVLDPVRPASYLGAAEEIRLAPRLPNHLPPAHPPPARARPYLSWRVPDDPDHPAFWFIRGTGPHPELWWG